MISKAPLVATLQHWTKCAVHRRSCGELCESAVGIYLDSGMQVITKPFAIDAMSAKVKHTLAEKP